MFREIPKNENLDREYFPVFTVLDNSQQSSRTVVLKIETIDHWNRSDFPIERSQMFRETQKNENLCRECFPVFTVLHNSQQSSRTVLLKFSKNQTRSGQKISQIRLQKFSKSVPGNPKNLSEFSQFSNRPNFMSFQPILIIFGFLKSYEFSLSV